MIIRDLGRRAKLCALALCVVAVSAARAEVPATAAHHFSSHPMISGTVLSVNDRAMVVDTDQGRPITLELDSRTMAPRDLAPGMFMRAEFVALEDCRFYAQRIIPVRRGVTTRRLQAYANTRDPRGPIERHAAATAAGETLASPESPVSARGSLEPTLGTMMIATPATADHRASSRPMITGRVITVNDHRLVIATDQGQHVGLVMDSRTMVPPEVAPGTSLRAEFTEMNDGRYYAKRIVPDGSGVEAREQAYAHTRDRDHVVVGNLSDCEPHATGGSGIEMTSAVAPTDRPRNTAAGVVEAAAASPAHGLEVLPQTAGDPAWGMWIGLLALGAAGLVAMVRRLRARAPARAASSR